MIETVNVKQPPRWWVRLRLAAILVTIWMGIGFVAMQHSFNTSARLSASRSEQAAQMAGVPLSADEATYFGNSGGLPAVGEGDRADQVVAIGVLAATESDRASDSITGMIATATGGVGSLVVFLGGLRDRFAVRGRQKRRGGSPWPRGSCPRRTGALCGRRVLQDNDQQVGRTRQRPARLHRDRRYISLLMINAHITTSARSMAHGPGQ